MKASKAAQVAELSQLFRKSDVVLTAYCGLTAAELDELRQLLHANASYVVVKNTLSALAAAQANVVLQFNGSSAIAFVHDDVAAAAKSLRDYGRTHPFLIIKGGVIDGEVASATDIMRLAELESREMLLLKMLAVLRATSKRTALLLHALLREHAGNGR